MAVTGGDQEIDVQGALDLAHQVGEEIRTPRLRIRIPRVILLDSYEMLPRSRVRFSRLNIYARDANQCQYCGKAFSTKELTLDHVVPRVQGGENSWTNLVCACVRCNAGAPFLAFDPGEGGVLCASCAQFAGRRVEPAVLELLADAGATVCQRLCLEITETAAVTNLADAAVFIGQVREAGVKVALDDFGAGASSRCWHALVCGLPCGA